MVTDTLLESENSKVELKSCIEKNIKPSKNYSTISPSILECELSEVNKKENTKPSKNYSTDTDDLLEGRYSNHKLPYLVFDFYVSLNKFSPSPYFSKDISDRKELHDKIWELHSNGMGYTKIHQFLIQNNYKIGKSRTCVDYILKKMKKRKQILSHPTTEKYKDFQLRYL